MARRVSTALATASLFVSICFFPSRIAAQIVSGIGFIGGGVIFVRKDLVRGLTTAATIWAVAAIGRRPSIRLVMKVRRRLTRPTSSRR